MTDERTLTQRLHDVEVPVPPDFHDRVQRGARRRLAHRRALTVTAAATGTAAVATLAAVWPQPHGSSTFGFGAGGGDQTASTTATVPSTTSTGASIATTVNCLSDATGQISASDDGLAAICLADPAPRFPYDRGSFAGMSDFGSGRAVLSKVFLLAAAEPRVVSSESGMAVTVPAGAEATIEIARSGAFPTSPSAVTADGVYTVVGTTSVLGCPATVVQTDAHSSPIQTGVVASVGGFDLAAYGEAENGSPDVTPAQMAALLNGLTGVPAGC